jgi:peptidoglycan-associated lipoprotein
MPADDSGDTNDVIDADGGAKTADEPEPSVRVGVREAADDGATAALSSERLRKLRFRFLAEVGDRVFFAENSATIGGRARAILEAQGRWLKAAKGLDVTIIGRSADGLDKDASAALSMARAKAVEAKLIEAGVPPERIKIEARGSADPVATCDSAMCRAQNRHAESLLGMPGMGGHAGRPQVLGGAGDTTGRTPPRTASTRTLAR